MRTIFYVTGSFDSGKTTRMINIFNGLPVGTSEGFACVKIYNEQKEVTGYALRRLSTNQEMMFIFDKRFYDDSFEDAFEFERFVISKDVLRHVSDVFEKALLNSEIISLLLDEVGNVELNDLGYSEILKEIIRSDKNVYLCVNDRHIEAISNKFDIKQYRCI